jgi:hypothetical protein
MHQTVKQTANLIDKQSNKQKDKSMGQKRTNHTDRQTKISARQKYERQTKI